MKKIQWTQHSMAKMRQYGLSKTKLLQIVYKPERKEVGIVPGTIAVMKTNKSYSRIKTVPMFPGSSIMRTQKKTAGEVWLMYKDTKEERKVISAWRYPGVSKPGEASDIIAKYSEIENEQF